MYSRGLTSKSALLTKNNMSQLIPKKFGLFSHTSKFKAEPSLPPLHPDSLGAHFRRVLEEAEKSRYTYSQY